MLWSTSLPSIRRTVAIPRSALHTSALARRAGPLNLIGKYAPPRRAPISAPLTQTPAQLPEAKRADAFQTTATAPVGASLQETPPPGSTLKTKVAVKLPAMASPSVEPAPTPSVPADEQEIKVAGVLIPAKPVPPGEEDCCMSGCVHCVYTIYADDLEEYTAALQEAKGALERAGTPVDQWPSPVARLVREGKSAGDLREEKKAEVRQGMDPSLAAFLALENKLKSK